MYEWKLIVENHVSIDVVVIIFVMSTFDFYLCIFVFL